MAILRPEIDIAGASLPVTDLKEGQLFYNTTNNLFYTYDGTQWNLVTGSGGGGVLDRREIVPTGATDGVNLTYTLAEQFSAGTLWVTRDGMVLKSGADFFEQPQIPGFTVTPAPLAGSTLLAFYALTASVVSPTQNIQTFVATSGQLVFNLGFSYATGTGALAAYSGGLRQALTTDYLETNSTSVTFTSGRQLGEIITFVAQGIQPNFAHGSTHNSGGADPITIPFNTGTTYTTVPVPLAGQPFYRTDLKTFAFYDGLTWNATIASSEMTKVQVSPSGTQNSSNTVFTLPYQFVPGTLSVTRNGLLLKNGVDFTEATGLMGFTMTVAPASTDTLLAFFKFPSTILPFNTGAFQRDNITPTGAVDASNITYTMPETFVSGSLFVTRNGLVLKNGVDFFESQALPGFTMTTPPPLNATVMSFYRVSNGVTANMIQKQTIVATASQTVFPLNISYAVGSGGLFVYSGGVFMVLGSDYTETSNSSVTFLTGRSVGENITFISMGVAPNFAHAATHSVGNTDPILRSNLANSVRIVTSGSSVTLAGTDLYVVVNKTVGSSTFVNLPSSPITGEELFIKDGKGDAATNFIVIQPATGTIDGLTNFIIQSVYSSVSMMYNGAEWSLL